MATPEPRREGFWQRLNRFLWPGPSVPLWIRLMPYASLVLAGLILFILAGAAWEYTGSNEFCGTTCHTMPPEYIVFQRSPHASVKCVECHIGRTYIAGQAFRKAGEISHVVAMITAEYETPIHAKSMRTAKETCEKCHNPRKYSPPSLQEIRRFDAERNNRPQTTYLAVETGGGTFKENLGTGIHWHIENKVEFVYTDEPYAQQEIPWVRVTYAATGKSRVFVDIDADVPADFDVQNPERLETMDCITCHNRIAHPFRSPETALDDYLARGLIDPTIPYIKKYALEVIKRPYPTVEEGKQAILGLVEYYQLNWPDYYRDHVETVYHSVRNLAKLYEEELVFPTMDFTWEAHPSNLGHLESPGCFRCHDGKHLDAAGQAIPANCSTCHSVPKATRPDGTDPDLPLGEPFVPDSHQDPNWIARHRFAFDTTCDGCHTVENPGGFDNSSFCANSGCHATDWQYTGLDSPNLLALVNVLDETLPRYPEADLRWETLIGPILADRCSACHGSGAELVLTDYEALVAAQGPSGPVLVPGDPGASPLLTVQQDGHPNRLPDPALAWLEEWIAAGAPR